MTRTLLTLLGLASLSAACVVDKERDGSKDGDGDTATDDLPDYDEGCNTVDGGLGYANINDAIAMAEDGSTIELCADSSHEEAVVIDKSVTIIGPGTDALVLVAPTNMDGITIRADNVSISGLSVESTRSGVVVESGTGTTLSDIVVVEAGNWGIKVEAGEDVSMSSMTLTGNGYGGIKVDGGSATIDSSDLSANVSFGVRAQGSGSVTVSNSDLSGTMVSESADSIDGVGIMADDGASVVSEGNTILGCDVMGIYVTEADAEISGDIIEGGLYGIAAILGDFSITDTTITDAYYEGALIATTSSPTVSGLEIIADPANVIDQADDDWATGDLGFAGTGFRFVADGGQISDTTVTGYNNCGIFLAAYSAGGEIVLDTVDVRDVGRKGIYVELVDIDATDVTVSGVLESEDQGDTLCYNLMTYGGVMAYEANISWTGGSVTDNAGYGLQSLYGSMAVDGISASGNTCAGVGNFWGTQVVVNSSFTAPNGTSLDSALVEYEGTDSIISGNSFVDGHVDEEVSYTYEYDTYTYTYTSSGQATTLDMGAYNSTNTEISSNSFTNGGAGLAIAGGTATLSENTFTNYAANAIELSYWTDSTDGATVVFDSNTFDSFGYNGIYCYASSAEFDGDVFQNGGSYGYDYEVLYEWSDGTTSQYSGTSEYTGYAISGNDCSLLVSNVEMTDLEGHAFYAYAYNADATYELYGVDIKNVGTGSSVSGSAAVYAYGYYGAMTLWLTDVNIQNVEAGHGIMLYPYDSSSSYTATVDARLDGVSIDDTAGYGIYAPSSRATLSMVGVEVSNTSSDGVNLSKATYTISDSIITKAGGSGLSLSSGQGSVSKVTATENAEYGMECADTVLSDCSDNDLVGNEMGEQTGCDEACGEEAGGTDTGS